MQFFVRFGWTVKKVTFQAQKEGKWWRREFPQKRSKLRCAHSKTVGCNTATLKEGWEKWSNLDQLFTAVCHQPRKPGSAMTVMVEAAHWICSCSKYSFTSFTCKGGKKEGEKNICLIRSLIANVIEVVMTLVFGATAKFRRSLKSFKRK